MSYESCYVGATPAVLVEVFNVHRAECFMLQVAKTKDLTKYYSLLYND